jgi:hypothetical protein
MQLHLSTAARGTHQLAETSRRDHLKPLTTQQRASRWLESQGVCHQRQEAPNGMAVDQLWGASNGKLREH